MIADVTKKLRGSLDVFSVSHSLSLATRGILKSTLWIIQVSGDVAREIIGEKTLAMVDTIAKVSRIILPLPLRRGLTRDLRLRMN